MSAIFDEDSDAETARRRWNAYLAAIDAEIADEARQRARFTTDIGKAIDAKPLTIKPGHQHYMAALRAGREDEYSNRMKARYGGEW